MLWYVENLNSLDLADFLAIGGQCEIVSKAVRELPPVMVFAHTESTDVRQNLGEVMVPSLSILYANISVDYNLAY